MLFFLLSSIFAHPEYKKGVAALKRKDLTVAERALKKCVNDEHYNIACHWELGWVYWLRNDWSLVTNHWRTVQKYDPNYQTLQKFLPQAEAKLASQSIMTMTTDDATAIDNIYREQGCVNRLDSVRSRTQKYTLNRDTYLFLSDCKEMPYGPTEGSMARLVITQKKGSPHYETVYLPVVDVSNRIKATQFVLAATFEGGMLKSDYRHSDWKVRRRWAPQQDGSFFLSESQITNFSGKKKLDYKHGKRHSFK